MAQTLEGLIDEVIRDLQAAKGAPNADQAVALVVPATERLAYIIRDLVVTGKVDPGKYAPLHRR